MKFQTALKLLCLSLAIEQASGCTCTSSISYGCDDFITDGTSATCVQDNTADPCESAVISGCTTVFCGAYGCQESTISASEEVTCSGRAACGRATLLTAPRVTCDGDACGQSTITATDEIICSQDYSCVGTVGLPTVMTANKVSCDGTEACGGYVTITSKCLDCAEGSCGAFSFSSGSVCQWAPDAATGQIDCVSDSVPEECPEPTEPTEPRDGGAFGDPHLVSFAGASFDYQGICDLVLAKAEWLVNGLVLPFQIQVRTQGRFDYSYIESAVLAIGKEKFQVSSFGVWFLNGVADGDLSTGIAGFPINYERVSDKIHKFEVQLDNGEMIVIKTMKDMVAVKIHTNNKENGHSKWFKNARGMMGDYNTGMLLGRNGTLVADPNELAVEWQVKQEEPMLFQSIRDPQYPAACVVPEPSAAKHSRRLGESIVSKDAAEQACASWPKNLVSSCIHDVIATGSLEVAAAGAW